MCVCMYMYIYIYMYTHFKRIFWAGLTGASCGLVDSTSGSVPKLWFFSRRVTTKDLKIRGSLRIQKTEFEDRSNSDLHTHAYCGWLRNPAPPKGWLKPYK